MKPGGQRTEDSPDLKKSLRKFWDGCDAYWDLLASEASTRSHNRELVTRFVSPGSVVLDLGCGNAGNAFYLQERGRYVGMDLSLTALRRAVQPGLKLVCGDADQLPFTDACFQTVVATFVLEHLVNPRRTLQEICRVTCPRGRIVFLGGTWDFPWWYPNSLRTRGRSKAWLSLYTLRRFLGQMRGWLYGDFPFLIVRDPDVFRVGYTWDEDAVYAVWSYEVVRFLSRSGCELVHWEVDDRLLGHHPVGRLAKRLLLRLPPYRYAGGTVLLVFQRGRS